MKPLIAIKELRYAGKNILPEEAFEADDKEAFLLKAIGKARDGKPVNKTDLPPAAKKKAEEPATIPLPESGLYSRRDMRAEDGLTGEDKPRLFSRRGRPPKARTSEDSED